jgi:dolichol-phosphate mannosyltransferase
MNSGSIANGTSSQRPLVSVVVPLFNEEENLPELYRRLDATLGKLELDCEFVFVNDGSRDQTSAMLEDLCARDDRVVAIQLSRNFGHQPAVSAGLQQAKGDVVFVMDGDLQDPPEVLVQFLDKWREGCDVVYAVRRQRKEGILKRAGYWGFYRLLRGISDLDIPLDSGDFCLMDRKVVDALNALPEKQRFVRGLRTFVGFRQIGLEYERDARYSGEPKYTFRALVRLAMDGLVSFSTMPLTCITYLGFFSVLVSMGLAAWVLLHYCFSRQAPAGWSSTIIVMLFLGSIQLLCLGIIGEYLRRIFLEVKERPTYIIRNVVRGSRAAAEHEAETRHRKAG